MNDRDGAFPFQSEKTSNDSETNELGTLFAVSVRCCRDLMESLMDGMMKLVFFSMIIDVRLFDSEHKRERAAKISRSFIGIDQD